MEPKTVLWIEAQGRPVQGRLHVACDPRCPPLLNCPGVGALAVPVRRFRRRCSPWALPPS
jgi:hypothetical protein